MNTMNREYILSPEEWMKFLSTCKKEKRMPYMFQLNTGARIKEMLNVRVSDINFNKKIIHLRITKKRTYFSDGNPRFIQISSKFNIELFRYVKNHNLKDGDYLFNISVPGYNCFLKRHLKKSGYKNWEEFSSHNLRKTLETWLVILDIGALRILKHFGHNRSTALKHYIQDDVFDISQKILIREILGDLYINISSNELLLSKIDKLENDIKTIKKQMKKIAKFYGELR